MFRDVPIRKKVMSIILLVSGTMLLLTCGAFVIYEYQTSRQIVKRNLSIIGEIISANSTAALAFENHKDANEMLATVRAEPYIIAAGIYDMKGNLFSQYPLTLPANTFPVRPGIKGYNFTPSSLEGFEPIFQGNKQLGTLYLKSDLGAIYERFRLYGAIVILIMVISFLLAYLLSRILQKGISAPILSLAETAKIVSDRKDYSVRASPQGKDELGALTDAFNQMLTQIQVQNFELSEFNQKLEQKVSERTLELEVANKELESFSYSVSHDLRAPLRSINGFSKILNEKYYNILNEDGRELLKIIIGNAIKMGRLIDDLLAFAQLGRRTLAKMKVDMKAMVLNVWEDLSRAESDRKIEFILKDLPDTYADAGTIKQVWINLISNALKYTKHTEKTVIEISSEEKDGTVIYCVKDNGTGFDMQYYHKLFGVFQRLHSQEEFEGTGVGLAIVQRIIEKHGGKVWATAKLNEGASFYFSLGS